LDQIAKECGNPRGDLFKACHFVAWRSSRLDAGNAPNTVNNALAYLRALFRELERIGQWRHPNPVGNVRRVPLRETELTFLDDFELLRLFEALSESRNRDAFTCAALAVSTGARWSEAEGITWDNVRADRVLYANTKNGRSRSVPLTACLAETLELRRKPDNRSGRVFRSCYSAFREAVQRAGLELPKGQLSHILRHTFASRFIHNGGNIVTLQRILGHSSIQITMRYSHLAPDHFEVVKSNNPLIG
jgi:integrase